MAMTSINGKSIKDLCGWRPDEERIADFNALNPRLAMQAGHLLATERRDVHLWNAIMAVMPSWRRGAQEIGDCFTAGTHVLGPDGVKGIEDVQVGDRVYAGDGSATEVITTQEKLSYKPLLTIHTTGGLPLTVTEDHKVLVYRFGSVDSRASGKHKRVSKKLYERVVAARDASKANSKWQLDRPNAVIDAFEGREAVLVEAKDLRTSDYLLCPVETKFDTRIPEPFLPLMGDKDTRWMIGLFLGDGNAVKAKATVSGLAFACTIDQPEVMDRLEVLFAGIGLSVKTYLSKKSNKARTLRVHNRELGLLFRNTFYDAAKAKVLPSWAICDDVVEGLRDADGHESRDGNIQYFDSTSPSLAHGVRLWAINAGFCPTMKEVKRSKGSYDNAKPLYRVRWQLDRTRERLWRDDDYLAAPITKIEAQEGPHTVYDIGVKHELHTFYANGVVCSNCVSWGSELVVTNLMCLKHVKGQGRFIAEAATEAIYGGCRVEALGKSRGGRSDGAFGAAAAKWVRDWGVILRTDMSQLTGIDEHDLREYSGQKAKDWGDYGCGGRRDGGKLDTAAKEMPVQHVVGVSSVEEAAAAIQNMYPITIASMAGFGDMRRDSNGICRRRGQWAHQMCVLGIRWRAGQPEFRVFQSWGPRSCSGPDPGIHHPAISGCSWWITPEDMAWILRTGDCWIHGDVHGLPPQNLEITRPASYWFQKDRPITYELAV